MSQIALNIGLKSLLASQTALENIGHNISNASTPGYSRQSVNIASSPAVMVRGLAIGSGVSASGILRTTDLLLHGRLVTQQSALAGLDTRLGGMGQVEALFGEPGDQGLNNLMQDFYGSLSSLAASPDELVLRTSAVQSAQTLSGRFNELSQGLIDARRDSSNQVKAQIERVNDLASSISAYNRKIASFEGGGAAANDLRDQRDEALKSLGTLINISFKEGSDGNVTVLTNGSVLVGKSKSYAMSAEVDPKGGVTLKVEGNPNPIKPKTGSIGGYAQLSEEFVPALLDRMNQLAHEFIRESNRAHATGIPSSGPFQSLKGVHAIQDTDQDGSRTDELLASSGLPFEVKSGSVFVSVTNRATGNFERTEITIDENTTTVQDFLDELNAIPNVYATLDNFGRLQMTADDGYGFDFSRRLNPNPDQNGTLGSARASIGTLADAPFALANGDTLDLTGPGGSVSVSFSSAQFADITQASAAELAAAINADPAVGASGLRAVSQGNHVFLQTLTEGSAETVTISGGTALSAMGLSAGMSSSGASSGAAVQLSGSYLGTTNDKFTLVPTSDGVIGTTPGLSIEVFDAAGLLVGTLDVGENYQPGTPLELANGLELSFGLGELSATNGDRLEIEALAQSDTSDVLVGLGLNALYTGTNAEDIALRTDIGLDPRKLAVSMTGAISDNGALQDLLDIRDVGISGLNDASFGEFYGDTIGGLGFDIEAASNARDVEQFLSDTLDTRREQISGVNIDEELVNMIQFQQSYSAAARYITVVNATSDEIMRLI